MSVGAFSIGVEFKYDTDYSADPLFVSPKYSNLKEEILESKYLNIKHYKKEILPKAEQYYKTKLVQSMIKAAMVGHETSISLSHLIGIILYTDYSQHSSHFSGTFRKIGAFETIQSIKRRHQKYYWMSNRLQEVIRYCDQCYYSELLGPFYCGMSSVMTMSQFTISLLSPTSTSCHLEVAMKFSDEEGMIIEFGNQKGQAIKTRGLDVSWLSRYKEEDERYINKYVMFVYTVLYVYVCCFLFFQTYSGCFLVCMSLTLLY